ncbi:MAG: PDZ domain-containing protein [Phycisphaeraceae bacterium]
MNFRNTFTLMVGLMMAMSITAHAADDKLAMPAKPATGDGVIVVEIEQVEQALPVEGVTPGQPGQAHRILVAPPVQGRRVLFIEGPDGEAGKRVIVAGEPRALTLKAPAMKKMTHLGVATSPVAPQVAAQLKLPEGFGLTVDFIEPESPADKAGLKQHDVIIKLGDQKLVNVMQLGTLVRAHKAGDTIDLTVIREGKEQVVKAVLVEKEKPVFDPVEGLQWWHQPAPFDVELLPQAGRAVPMNRGHRVLKFADDEHELDLTIDKDGKKLTVKDKAGKVLFEGPIDTDEEREAIPEAVKPKLQKMEKSAGARTPFGPRSPGAAVNPGRIELDLDFDGKQLADLIQRHMQQLPQGADQDAMRKQIEAMQKQIQSLMQEKMKELHQKGFAPGAPGADGGEAQRLNLNIAGGVASASFSDGTHTLTIKTEDGKKQLTARKKEGNTLYQGHINTDEERAKVPDELRGKLKMLESNRIEIRGQRLNPRLPAEPEPRKPSDREQDRKAI